MINLNKIGKIAVSDSVMHDDSSFVLLAMAEFGFCPVSLSVEHQYRQYVFTGYCDTFEELGLGSAIPSYRLEVTKEADAALTTVKVFQV